VPEGAEAVDDPVGGGLRDTEKRGGLSQGERKIPVRHNLSK
jgi:hypothetical protein